MEVSVTQFRRNLFSLVDQAMQGSEIWVSHKGRQFRIVPDDCSRNRLSRITPLEIINSESSEQDELSLEGEMKQAWERDWSEL